MTKTRLEDYGFCSKTGVCINPFGAKPPWVIKLAASIRKRDLLETTEEAPF